MATGTKSRPRPPADSGRTGPTVTHTLLIALLVGVLIVGGAVGFFIGWKKHTHQPEAPFRGTISRVGLDNYAVCVRPTAGGSDICDPLYRRADEKPPEVGDTGWFTYAYDKEGDLGYTLLVQVRGG
jgi:hypothetical protein